MANDTMTLKLTLHADFQTIQTIRRTLNDEVAQQTLTARLQRTVAAFLETRQVGAVDISAALTVSRVRETKKGTLPTPVLQNGVVTIWDADRQRVIDTIAVDGKYWTDFLCDEVEGSFRYDHPRGHFTAIREQRRGRQVWYAHRRYRGRLKRLYLGVPQTLTGKKLAAAAQKMSRWVQKISRGSETEIHATPARQGGDAQP